MLKTIKYLMVSVATAGLVACGGGDGGDDNPPAPSLTQDSPGKIAGLGLQPGNVAGQAFALPAGIKTNDLLMGLFVVPATTSNTAGVQIAQGDAVDKIVGTGYAVAVRIPLQNTTGQDIDVEFPRGLVVLSTSGTYQHGVLLVATRTKVPANSTVTVALITYCGNETKPGSLRNVPYSLGVVSSSSTLYNFTELLKDKKIGAEYYGGNSKEYSDMAGRLQEMLHKLTDKGEALNSSDTAFIKALPNK